VILVTGASGQLGNSLRAVLTNKNTLFCPSSILNISNQKSVAQIIATYNIKCIINCAAYTDVEGAESDVANAFAVNELGVRNLAIASGQHDIKLIHISTDYVFDGRQNVPYTEQDATNPINVYGASKLAGEKAIMQYTDQAIIIRTSWLYSSNQFNFVDKIISMLQTKPELNIVYDQLGSPTYCHDLAECIVQLINHLAVNGNQILHYSNEGSASWYDFACAISKITGIIKPINPVRSSYYPSVVARPPYSLLAKDKIKDLTGIHINHWLDSLAQCIMRKQY
jgi:dTDP-4-dehydrorhamnose reductase